MTVVHFAYHLQAHGRTHLPLFGLYGPVLAIWGNGVRVAKAIGVVYSFLSQEDAMRKSYIRTPIFVLSTL
jgi:hypothetical protein